MPKTPTHTATANTVAPAKSSNRSTKQSRNVQRPSQSINHNHGGKPIVKTETTTLLKDIDHNITEIKKIQKDLEKLTELKTLILKSDAARRDFTRKAIV
jgi:hypothetical protein